MEDCEGLSGLLTAPINPDGTPAFPGQLTLSGRMVITVQPDGAPEPINLRSRVNPILAGSVPEWPPFNMTLNLTSGPVPYFDERQIDDPTASPVLTVTANKVTLGPGPSLFQSTSPEIVRAVIVDTFGLPWRGGPVGGTKLTWEDNAIGLTECPIGGFNVYRNPTPGILDGWTLLAFVPATQTSLIDPLSDGTSPVEYSIIHTTRFNFDYQYEGAVGVPVVFQPVCDINVDGVVNRRDIDAIFMARGTFATPGDPRDVDGDRLITVNDARICTLLRCTRPLCAP